MPADPHIISRNLTRIAVFLRRLEIVARERNVRKALNDSAAWLERAAIHLHRQETHMGRTADQINKLEQALAASRANASHLQGQLDAATANALDSADVLALDGVDAAIGDTVAGGTAPDTTPGGAGGTT
jgi:ferritin-like metal-binding protein YciE